MTDSDDFRTRYRRTIGLFATGVTVLLAERDGELRGMTANAITSLSLDPTLLIVCPSKKSRFGNLMEKGVPFTISILGDHEEDVSNHFAKTGDKGLEEDMKEPYPLTGWEQEDLAPRLEDCIGALACRVHEMHDGGDHWIVVGEVLDLYDLEGELWPLLFFRGRYHHPSRTSGDLPAADPLS
jgi:flavin reductase (DIM6/NTAB) family NADH-FMN oxidoreductase RutF